MTLELYALLRLSIPGNEDLGIELLKSLDGKDKKVAKRVAENVQYYKSQGRIAPAPKTIDKALQINKSEIVFPDKRVKASIFDVMDESEEGELRLADSNKALQQRQDKDLLSLDLTGKALISNRWLKVALAKRYSRQLSNEYV